MLISGGSSFESLQRHRDLLVRKISALRLGQGAVDQENDRGQREMIYGLREERALKEKELNSVVGFIRVKQNQTIGLRRNCEELESLKKNIGEHTKQLKDERENIRRNINSQVVQDAGIRREISQWLRKREGLVSSHAEIGVTITQTQDYVDRVRKASAYLRESLKELETRNNQTERQIEEIYGQEEKSIESYSRYLKEVKSVQRLADDLRETVNLKRQEVETISCLLTSEEEKQTKAKLETAKMINGITHIEDETMGLRKENSTLSHSKDQLQRQYSSHQSNLDQLGIHIESLLQANYTLSGSLARFMDENQASLPPLFQRQLFECTQKPHDGKKSFASTRSDFNQ